MKSILFFHTLNDYSGSTRVLSSIISEEYKDQKVTIITQRNKDNGFLSLLPNIRLLDIWIPKVKGKTIPIITPLGWRIHALLLGFIYGRKYEVFYINTILPYYASFVARLYGKKIIWHIHEKFIIRTLSVRLAEYVFNHTPAHRIFVSKYLKGQYINNKNCTWEIKYNKLPYSFISQIKKKPIEERNRNQILMIASLTLTKGLDMFVKLAELIPDCDFSLILNANIAAINNFFLKYNVPENCKLISAQSNIHPFLHETDLLLNLSNPTICVETFGMTILEAMSYGIPAIVPNVGGPTELVKNGFNGYLVDVRNIEEIKKAIYIALEKQNYIRLVNNTILRFSELS